MSVILKLRPEKVFLFFSLIFGFLFLILTPPFQVPDEFYHFFRSYNFSCGVLLDGLLPKSLTITASAFDYLPFHSENKANPEVIFSLLHLPLENQIKWEHFQNNLFPAAYFPQILGITLGRSLNLSPLLLMYLGRIANLIFWIFLIYTAIKIIPIFKCLICLLALSPMALFQAASLSKDAFTIGGSFLVIALTLQYAFDENKIIKTWDLLLLFLLTFAVFMTKRYCFFLFFIFFLIPTKKVGSKKRYFTFFILSICVSLISSLAWNSFAEGTPTNTFFSNNGKMLFVFTNPTKWGLIVINTLLSQGFFLESFIGQLGWLDTALPASLRYFYGFMLILVALLEKTQNIILGVKEKTGLFFIFIFGLMSVFVGAYISWFTAEKNLIEGIQGRYFIPLGPLLFLLLYNQKIGFLTEQDRWIGRIAVATILITLSTTSFVLFHRYYD